MVLLNNLAYLFLNAVFFDFYGIENYRLDREYENNLIVKVATVCIKIIILHFFCSLESLQNQLITNFGLDFFSVKSISCTSLLTKSLYHFV